MVQGAAVTLEVALFLDPESAIGAEALQEARRSPRTKVSCPSMSVSFRAAVQHALITDVLLVLIA